MDKKIIYTGKQNNPDGAPNRRISYTICFLVVLLTIIATVILSNLHLTNTRFFIMTASINLLTLIFILYTRFFSGEASDYEANDVTTSWTFSDSDVIIEEFFGVEGNLTSYRYGNVILSDKNKRYVRYHFEKSWIRRIILDDEIHAFILAWNDNPKDSRDVYALFFVNADVEEELFSELERICRVEKDNNGSFLRH